MSIRFILIIVGLFAFNVSAGRAQSALDGFDPNANGKNILVIVAIQTAFDLSTPQISMAAHMSGLVTGFILGFVMSPRAVPE